MEFFKPSKRAEKEGKRGREGCLGKEREKREEERERERERERGRERESSK